MYAEKVHIIKNQIPVDYHCSCSYCMKAIGELRQENGDYYNRLERRQYYDETEKGPGGHIAKSPLHIARWAIQKYTQVGDWVLDPTIGAGTTAVEAITQRRHVAGMELEYGDILVNNIKKALQIHNGIYADKVQAKIGRGDARNIAEFLGDMKFQLVVSNPPYSGDISMPSPKGDLRGKEHRHLETQFKYDKSLPNLAFLKEGEDYWTEMTKIYKACIDRLLPGGYFITGIKDMSRNKEPFLLHQMFCTRLADMGLSFVGTAFLRHYPGTLFLNSCEKIHGFKPPVYQTINVFRKKK